MHDSYNSYTWVVWHARIKIVDIPIAFNIVQWNLYIMGQWEMVTMDVAS